MGTAGLCDLPDDLLRHVLSFAPAKEAAATAVLSRRWRSLWRTSGAVNLDSRSYGRPLSAGTREGFFRGAEAALAAAARGGPLRKLTLHVELEAQHHHEIAAFLSHRGDGRGHDMVGAVLSNPAARRVEELHVAAHVSGLLHLPGAFYELGSGALPSEALRVLHITNCGELPPAPSPGGAAAFPLLAELWLRGGAVSFDRLRSMIHAAPQLATLDLDCIYLDGEEGSHNGSPPRTPRYRLCCAAVTTLVVVDCTYPGWVQGGIELDAPRLRYLRFRGHVCLDRFSLKSHALDLEQVDLHFVTGHVNRGEDRVRTRFWQFLQNSNFNNTKILRLKLEFPTDYIAIDQNEDWDELLGSKLFRDLERLELEVTLYSNSNKASAFAMANLLHCCPVLCDLRLKLSMPSQSWRLSPSESRCVAETKAQLNFKESVDHFKHRNFLLDRVKDDSYEVSDIPGLSEHSFNCLENYLRRVSLQFRMERSNCFGTQLAKFFAENAMALEDMYIDDGNHRICDHLIRKVETWSANSPKRRNLRTAKGFRILPQET
ncbi:hypothetical protein ACP4OV_004546 [Aristida adscensionis]